MSGRVWRAPGEKLFQVSLDKNAWSANRSYSVMEGQHSTHSTRSAHIGGGGGGGGGSANIPKVKMELEGQQALLMKHWEDREIKSLAELYTNGCTIMPPDSSINFGRPGLSRAANQIIDSGCHILKMVTGELEVASNNLAVERGGYKYCRRDKQIVETGKYVIVWKRMDGQLKIHMHIWNRNQ